MPRTYRQIKFDRTSPTTVAWPRGHVPKGLSVRFEQLPERSTRNDNILRINGVRVKRKEAMIRAAAGQYPVLCQFEETGKRHQLSNPFRIWKRRFNDQKSLEWALGDIEGPFIATIRSV